MRSTTTWLCLISVNLFSQPQSLTLTNFTTGYSQPVDIAHAGDSRLFIVQQRGMIFISDSNGSKVPTPFLDITAKVSASGSERGLLGLAFHPDYTNNGYFFVNYTEASSSGNTVVARYQVTNDPNLADPNSEDIVITIVQDFSNHNGGCIKFGDDGYLYIGMGDGGSGGDPNNRAQNPTSLLGKMLRLDVDVDSGYAIPPDNPYAGSLSVANEIWAMGYRNPWRFSFDRLTQDMWVADVGQGIWEEIDVEPAGSLGGLNYGWRCYEGFAPYNTAGCQGSSFYEKPVFDYPHGSDPGEGCSVTGGFVYRGARYKSMWGSYIFTDYCTGSIWALSPNGIGYDTTFLGDFADYQYSSFGEDACGELYVARIGGGAIQRVEDTTCTPTAYITSADTLSICADVPATLEAVCGRGVAYAWFLDDTIPVGTTRIITVNQDGWYRVRASRGSCNDLSDPVYVIIHPLPLVTLSMAQTTFVTTDSAVTLTGTPAGGTFSGPGVAGDSFDPGTAGAGTFQLFYQYTDSNGCSAADTVEVTVDFLGIHAPLAQVTSVFPNPAHDAITVALDVAYSSVVSLSLFDALGRRVMHDVRFVPYGHSTLVLPLTALSSGAYALRIDTDRESTVKEIIVGH